VAKIVIHQDKCKGCLLCVSFCPKGLINTDERLNRQGVKPVKFNNNSPCLGCTLCALICPDCCIEVWK
jgi:2-oxoglutarate ferredoxin oxidoreductase subunit delta